MKITKSASGKQEIRISKQDWQNIGKKAGWMKQAAYEDMPGWMLGDLPQTSEEMLAFVEDRLKTIKKYLSIHKHKDSIIGMAIEVGNTLVDEMPKIIHKEFEWSNEDNPDPEYAEDNLSDVDADAMTLRDAEYGTDEDYGSASDIL